MIKVPFLVTRADGRKPGTGGAALGSAPPANFGQIGLSGTLVTSAS